MGAIAGILGLHSDKAVSKIKTMLEVLSHRGRDGVAYSCIGPVALGQCRMNVTGSLNQSELYVNRDRNIIMTFDGEIYNHQILRNRLNQDDIEVDGTRDASVIIPLYERHGELAWNMLEGMFAFGLYDVRCGHLYLVRDRVGEKPLIFLSNREVFCFASEHRAIQMISGMGDSVDADGLRSYLSYRVAAAPMTILPNHRKVVPGHFVEVTPSGEWSEKPYWRIDFTDKVNMSFQQAKEELRSLLRESVFQTLSGNGPVGVALSGGVDSSLVLGIARETQTGPLTSISLGLGSYYSTDKAYPKRDEEFNRAQHIAKLYNTEHYEVGIFPHSFEEFCSAIATYDEPIGLLDAVHGLQLTKMAANSVQALTTGDGADVLFFGRSSWLDQITAERHRQKQIDLCADPEALIQSYICEDKNNEDFRITKRFLSDDLLNENPSERTWKQLLPYFVLASQDSLCEQKAFVDGLLGLGGAGSLWDAIGMLHGVEMRSPFYNNRIINFSAKLPLRYKIWHKSFHRTKRIVRSLAESYMPRVLVNAPKLDFGHYVSKSYVDLMRSSWKDELQALVFRRARNMSGLLSVQRFRREWDRFQHGELARNELWEFLSLIILLIWCEHREVTV